jgi:parallel beta-helix repeat protein
MGTMTAQAVTRYVPDEYLTIQAAIDAAVYGDTVQVGAGTYFENITLANGVRLIGEVVGVDPNNTIIDANNSGSVVTSLDCDPNTVLEGFTLTNGKGTWNMAMQSNGGGVYCLDSGLIIRNCTFSSNVAVLGRGGGIYCRGSSPKLINCTFNANYAYDGGGVFCGGESHPELVNCTFIANTADYGGGMSCVWGSNPSITGCTFTGNSADYGGGGISGGSDSNPSVTNCILWGNLPEQIAANASVTYSDVQGGWEGEGNIDEDPLFVSEANDDYHLQFGSPCIDAGDPNYIAEPEETDLDGNERIINGIVDMGAYEANPIEANLRMLPRVINRRNRMRYIFAIVRLPKEIERDDIESDEPLVLYPGEIEAKRQHILGGRGRRKSDVQILGFFDKADFTAAVPENGRVEVNVAGRVKTGRYFYGTDEIRVVDRRNGRSGRK